MPRTCLFCAKTFRPKNPASKQLCCSKPCGKKLTYKDTLHNEEWITTKYVKEGLSTGEIAELVGSTSLPVCMSLEHFGIARRSQSASKKLRFDRLGRKWVSKQDLIAAYGGVCACCGETEAAFLTLDHVGGGGGKHRQTFRDKGQNHVQHIRQELKAAGWPRDKYRLLCMNCQFGYMHGRTCPHQLRKQQDPVQYEPLPFIG